MKSNNLLRLAGAALLGALVFASSPSLFAQSASTYVASGLAKFHQGNLDGAIADYTQALELNSSYLGAYNNRGMARSAQGNFDGAIADYSGVKKRLLAGFANEFCDSISTSTADAQSKVMHSVRDRFSVSLQVNEQQLQRTLDKSLVELADVAATLRETGHWEGTLEQKTKDGRAITVSSKLLLMRGDDGVDRQSHLAAEPHLDNDAARAQCVQGAPQGTLVDVSCETRGVDVVLAVRDPAAFAAVVESAKGALPKPAPKA